MGCLREVWSHLGDRLISAPYHLGIGNPNIIMLVEALTEPPLLPCLSCSTATSMDSSTPAMTLRTLGFPFYTTWPQRRALP